MDAEPSLTGGMHRVGLCMHKLHIYVAVWSRTVCVGDLLARSVVYDKVCALMYTQWTVSLLHPIYSRLSLSICILLRTFSKPLSEETSEEGISLEEAV